MILVVTISTHKCNQQIDRHDNQIYLFNNSGLQIFPGLYLDPGLPQQNLHVVHALDNLYPRISLFPTLEHLEEGAMEGFDV